MLVIWDFDGVICDSDGIWANNWAMLLKSEKNIIKKKFAHRNFRKR